MERIPECDECVLDGECLFQDNDDAESCGEYGKKRNNISKGVEGFKKKGGYNNETKAKRKS